MATLVSLSGCAARVTRRSLMTSKNMSILEAVWQHNGFMSCGKQVITPTTRAYGNRSRHVSSGLPLKHLRPVPNPTHAPCAPPSAQQRRWITKLFKSPIPKHYNDVPNDYTDEDGLRYSIKDLEDNQAKTIFGAHMQLRRADKLLKILHGRRVAGTLQDPLYAPNTKSYSAGEIRAALKYLRDTVPVNEVVNAGLRAEDELRALDEEQEEAEDSIAAAQQAESQEVLVGKSLVKPSKTSRPASSSSPPSLLPKPDERPNLLYQRPVKRPASRTGESELAKIRARNVAAQKEREEQARLKQEEDERNGIIGGLDTIHGTRGRGLAPVREPSEKMKMYLQQATSTLTEPPEMSKAARLFPMTVSALVATAVAIAIAEYWPTKTTPTATISAPDTDTDTDADSPPKKKSLTRFLPNLNSATGTVSAVIALNILVLILWRVPALWRFGNRYMLLDVAVPRFPQVITASWSHQYFQHLSMNMFFVAIVGIPLCNEIGGPTFLSTYIACGVLGHLLSFWEFVLTSNLAITTLGASGAVYGLMACYFWLHKFAGFKVFDLPPDPAKGIQGLAFVALMVALNIGMFFSRGKAMARLVDAVSHVAGIAAGIGCAEYVQWQRRRRRRRELEEEEKEKEKEDGEVVEDAAMRKGVVSGNTSITTSQDVVRT